MLVVVHPVLCDLDIGLEQSYAGEYRVGFIDSEGTIQICTIVIPPLEGHHDVVSARPVALRVGREDVFFFVEAIGVDRPIMLKVLEYTTPYALKHNPKHKEIVLL